MVVDGDLPLEFAVAELSLKAVAISFLKFAHAALLVLVPVAGIDIAIFPCIGSRSGAFSVKETLEGEAARRAAINITEEQLG